MSLLLLFTVFILAAHTHAQTPTLGAVTRGYTISSNQDLLVNFALTQQQTRLNFLNFTVFPCFGSFDWFLGYGAVPTPNGDNACNQTWTTPNSRRMVCTILFPDDPNPYPIIAQGKETYPEGPLAIFDLFIFSSNGFNFTLTDIRPIH
jgi:hypothetical protein